jgi:peptidoglycan hydrolase-like protein with peptidoglycan-binding domain
MYPTGISERTLRLTTTSVKDDTGPEAYEIDLSRFEGSILRVLGHGGAVSQAQRALRRTPGLTLEDGDFGPLTETATKEFQQAQGLPVTGVVDGPTWKALPDGNPMPLLQQGNKGDAVRSLQAVLTEGAFGPWERTPHGVDGIFGANTAASVRAFQTWAGCAVDGVVGPETWNAALDWSSSPAFSAPSAYSRSPSP